MQKIGTNPNTGNSVVFDGGEWEWEQACQYDDEMQREYDYEMACHAVGVMPYGAWDREDDGEFPFDQPDSVGR